MTSLSIVEYFGKNGKGSCGYCKGKKTSFSHGMWGHVLTPQDYQDLIDRGWRRSGKYVYKPTMKETCCPQYTIRCSAIDFQLGGGGGKKSHRKSLKKFRNFVVKDAGSQRKQSHQIAELPPQKRDPLYSSDDDDTATTEEEEEEGNDEASAAATADDVDFEAENADQAEKKIKFDSSKMEGQQPSDGGKECAAAAALPKNTTVAAAADSSSMPPPQRNTEKTTQLEGVSKAAPKPGLGPDPNKPKPRKAKDIRRERALMKANKAGEAAAKKAANAPKKKNTGASLEDLTGFFFREENVGVAKHKLEVRMVRATQEDPEFRRTVDESFEVYRKYQVMIHKDKPNDCTMNQFKRFLCSSPILEGEPVAVAKTGGFPPNYFPRSYGGYHQQYVLDGKIICVGVLDILPNCVSSVYLYYDPDFSFLSLGTVSALMEIAYVRDLQKHWSSKLRLYYMGFYIHSCPKMRYKAQYHPSQLLCPATFEWVDVRDCISPLDKAKYARLNKAAAAAVDQLAVVPSRDSVARVMILHRHKPNLYGNLSRSFPHGGGGALSEEDQEVAEYYSLVGEKVSRSMLLYRASD